MLVATWKMDGGNVHLRHGRGYRRDSAKRKRHVARHPIIPSIRAIIQDQPIDQWAIGRHVAWSQPRPPRADARVLSLVRYPLSLTITCTNVQDAHPGLILLRSPGSPGNPRVSEGTPSQNKKVRGFPCSDNRPGSASRAGWNVSARHCFNLTHRAAALHIDRRCIVIVRSPFLS